MKYSFPVTCGCGMTFPVFVTGTKLPKCEVCPGCEQLVWLVEPLGNIVGMAILGRAEKELKNEDWTLTIVLAAMAVECELVYLFMKWSRIDLMLVRNPTDADEEVWEKEWRDEVRTISARLDKVSGQLAGHPFNPFLSKNGELLKAVQARYASFERAASPKDFFIRELFHKRNRIVHFGNIDFQQPDAEMCLTLASTLAQILGAMDVQRRRALEQRDRP